MKANNIIKTISVTATAFLAVCCTDTWDEHYGAGNLTSDKSLLQLVEEAGDLNDFLSVLKKTHVFVNNKPSKVTYADLLGSDQTFTVWAPKDGTFNVDSLLEECQTVKGDSMCGQHFIQNHIAHYITNNNSAEERTVMMLNDKYLDQEPGSFHGVPYAAGRANEPAKNGVLHVLEREVPYVYNIYEGITTLPEYSSVGSFFKKKEKMELDENSSIQSGIVDGMIIYSDSVMRRSNILFGQFGLINEEDSNFIMLQPSERVWNEAFAEACSHFNYGTVNKADSLMRYWANISLIRDLVYNRNYGCAHMADSVYSTSYNIYDEERHHVFYKPLQPGGIFSSTYVVDSLECSNGVIYELGAWPFKPEQIYFFPVKTEGEIENMITDYKDCTFNYRSAVADSISNGYLDIVPRTTSSNWTATFQVPDVLSGTYEICLVILPKTAYNPNSRDFKPNKFKATIYYETEEGIQESYEFEDECVNDPYRVDTVSVGRFSIPVCSYAQSNSKVHLKVECSISRRETQYSREMYLDCLYFKPVNEE